MIGSRRRALIALLLVILYPLLVAWQVQARTPDLVRTLDALRLACGQSPAIVAEYHHLKTDMADAGYWITGDYAGTYYHFRDGERWVPSAPVNARYTLWLFGNSGLMDPWIADIDTAAAKLQALLPGYHVRNRSAGGQHVAGQLAWLRETPVQAGDLVVFVDGAMDAGSDVGALIRQAEAYTRAHSAAFWHFRQPVADPASIAAMPGLPIYVTADNFIEGSHLNERGAAIEALQIYDHITVY